MSSVSNKEEVEKNTFSSNCACILLVLLLIFIFIDLAFFNQFSPLSELSLLIPLFDAAKWIIVAIILIILVLKNSN